jgi:predicted amidohydrolase
MAHTKFLAAAAQMTSGEDVPKNLATCDRLAREAKARGVELLVLPENFAYLGRRERDRVKVAEVLDTEADGPIVAAVCKLARDQEMWIVAGGMPEHLAPPTEGETPTQTHNTCFVLSPAGEIAARYRKIHMFDIDIPGHAQFRESESTKRGNEVVVVETPLARLGLSICYDLRFPELYRELARLDADILMVPAAFTAHTGEAHWHTLLRARAIENQCFVIAAAQAGRHNEVRASWGHSEILDPWGTTLAVLGDETALAIAEIDLGRIAHVRRQLPCHEHRVL